MSLTRTLFILMSGLFFLCLTSAGCQTTGQALPAERPAPIEGQVRFLLTFDDGPAVASPSPTAAVLESLAHNSVQSGIKAIFFLQTRDPKHGGSQEGRRLMEREHAEGHVLGLHSGTARGHVNHTTMKPDELLQSLTDGMGDIKDVTGRAPLFVRPTFWRYNAETLARYESSGLSMMLSDVKAYDGVNGLFHFSGNRRGSMLSELQRVRTKIDRGEIPLVNGIFPVVVTFHDTNTFTAGHVEEYLQILVEETRQAGLSLSSRSFYDEREELVAAALQRAEHRVLLETRLPARLAHFFKSAW